MEGGKEEAAQTHPFYPALVYGAFRPHGQNPKHELLPSLFRTNFYFYFFRLASELQQPAATYAAGGWGREEESQFIKFYFAVENLPVALKHFIKKSFNSKKKYFLLSKSQKVYLSNLFPTRFPHWPWRQHLITLFYPLSLTYLKPDSRLVWVNRKLSALFTLSKLYSSLVIFMSQRLVSFPSAEGNEPQWKRVIICLCIGVHVAAWKKRGGKKRNEIPVRKWGRETKTSD